MSGNDSDAVSDTTAAVMAWIGFATGFVAAARTRNWKRGLLAGVWVLPAAMFVYGMISEMHEDEQEIAADGGE